MLDGSIRRLIVNLPPRHSKSELFSRTLPGAYLARYPDRSVILCSYGAELAQDLSQDARDRYVLSGRALRDDTRAARNWMTAEGGRMVAAGVRGPITGRGAHLAVIDDFYRDDEQASSPTVRRKTERWYDAVLSTRLEPDAAVVIVATRWHPDDLVGWLMGKEEEEAPEGWTVLSLPAISEEGAQEFPEAVTVVGDFRDEPGLALCPERMPIERLEHIRQRSLPFFWSALWQNRPTAEAGDLFQRAWFDAAIYVDPVEVPRDAERVRSWDKAGTIGGGDWTVGVLFARASDGTYYVENVIRGQWGDFDRERIIRETAIADNRRYKTAGRRAPVSIIFEQEPGSGGKQSAAMTARTLEGFQFYIEKPVTNKVARARPLASYFKAGQVRLVRADWNRAYVEELVAFRDKNSQADQVDAS